MATVKILLWKHYKKKDNKFPIAIRITKDRKTRYVFTGKYIAEKDWDSDNSKVKKSHPNSARLNNYLLKKLTEADDALLEATSNDESVTSKQIQKKVKRKGKKVSFFQHAAERIQTKFDKGTFSVARSELSILYNIKECLKVRNSSGSKQEIIKGIKQRRADRHKKGMNPKTSTQQFINEFKKDESLYFSEMDLSFIKRYKAFCST